MKNYELISKKIIDVFTYKEDYINYYGFEKANKLYCIFGIKHPLVCDQQIMENYNFSLEEYSQIIFKNNGIKDTIYDKSSDYSNFAFLNEQDCKNAIEELQAYIVMKQLKN